MNLIRMSNKSLLTPAIIKPEWPNIKHVEVFTTLRTHGYSQGCYGSFNPASHVGDYPELVRKNRSMLSLRVGSNIHWLDQTHSTNIIDLDTTQRFRIPHSADGAITTRPNAVCAVMTADCLPVVIAEKQGQMISVAHAGWKGLVTGIIEALLQRIHAKGCQPKNLQAWIGPAISQPHYEVNENFKQQFQHWPNTAFIASRKGHWFADLKALCAWKLQQLGVNAIYSSPLCTYQDPRLFSYRAKNPCGRNVTIARITQPTINRL